MHKLKPIKEFIGAAVMHFFVRLIIAALTSHIIVIYREAESVADLLYDGDYWPAFFGSFFIAWLLIEWVFQITYFLERKSPWQNGLWRRCYKQFLAGFLGGCIIAILGASLYFVIRQVNITDTDYFQHDLLPVAIFCFALNVLYCFLIYLGTVYQLWLQMSSLINSQRPQFLMNWSAREEYLAFKKVEEKLGAKSNDLSPTNDDGRADNKEEATEIFTEELIARVFCVCILSKVIFIFDQDANKTTISLALTYIMEALPEDDFFMINQSCIMRRSLIVGTKAISSRRVLLLLKPPFDELEYDSIKVVSQRASNDFLIWYKTHKG